MRRRIAEPNGTFMKQLLSHLTDRVSARLSPRQIFAFSKCAMKR